MKQIKTPGPTLLKTIYILVCIGLSLLAYQLVCFFAQRMVNWQVFAGMMDWSIFVDYALRYVNTGQLYEQNLALYGPGEPIYKFPPLFLAVVIFFFQHGASADAVKYWSSMLHVFLYFVTAAILLFGIKRKNIFLLYPFAIFFLLTFEAFFDNYVRLQLEIYIVLLLSVSLLCLNRKKYFSSGFFLGFASGLKIYPAFFCITFVIQRNYRALAGVMVGFIVTIAISLTAINLHEHWFYFTHIVPFMFKEGIYFTPENISISYFAVVLHFPVDQASFIARVCLMLGVIIVIVGTVLSNHYTKTAEKNYDENDALKISAGFSVLISAFVVGTQNSWWNYQLLLMIPIMVLIMAIVDKRYFNWILLLATVCGCLFIYCGSTEQLKKMTLLSNVWFGSPNPIEQLFVHSVYLRATASVLIYVASVQLYWQTCGKQIRQ